jgi:hypothetical protein
MCEAHPPANSRRLRELTVSLRLNTADQQYADVIAGKCRDFIYTDDDSSSVSTHGSGNIDPFELKNKIEGTESKSIISPSSQY